MDELSKSQRKVLRDCAARVYEAEATRKLEELECDFKRWRDRELDVGELLESIHKFHQVQAKDLWSIYQSLKPPEIVARGIALQLVAESDVPEDIIQHLRPLIAFFSRTSE